jgi:hypothetical protein
MSDQSQPESQPKALEERADPVTFFSPEIHNQVTGMTYLGKHTKEIKFIGHRFILETIRPHLKLAIGQAMEPYRNTLGQPLAWAAMHVGIALASIDGNRSFCPPIGNDEVEYVNQRFHYITDETGWWDPAIEYLFAEYSSLEMETTQAIAELHSLALAGKAISLPWPGFSTETEPSTAETNTGGLRLEDFS